MPKARFTIQDIQKSKVAGINKHIEVATQDPKQSKFRNTATMVDGIRFDSKKEATRYKQLKLLLKAGAIGMLRRQVPYELNEGGTFSYKYVADFVYVDAGSGKEVVEDTKGWQTDEYKKKKKLMKRIHGIIIKET